MMDREGAKSAKAEESECRQDDRMDWMRVELITRFIL